MRTPQSIIIIIIIAAGWPRSAESSAEHRRQGQTASIEILHPTEPPGVPRHDRVFVGAGGRRDEEIVRPDHLPAGPSPWPSGGPGPAEVGGTR